MYFPGRSRWKIVFRGVSVNENLPRLVGNAEAVTVHVGTDTLPGLRFAGAFPLIDLDPVEAARGVTDRAGKNLFAFGFAPDVDEAHGNAADGDAGRIGNDLTFA